MNVRILAAILFGCTALGAADRGFDEIVKAIESHYGVKRTHIPLLGVGNLFLKTARPAGVSGFKIAVFDDLAGGDRDAAGMEAFMDRLGDSNLNPVVQVRSRRSGEMTYIYTGPPGKWTRMLVASIEPAAATVVEVKVNTDALIHLLRDPGHISDALGVHHGEPDDR